MVAISLYGSGEGLGQGNRPAYSTTHFSAGPAGAQPPATPWETPARGQGQLLQARVQEIEQQRRDRAAELRLLEGVDAFCASIRDAMVTPSFEVKQKVLQLVVQRIVVEDHRVIIEHVVPSGPIRLQPERHAPAGPS